MEALLWLRQSEFVDIYDRYHRISHRNVEINGSDLGRLPNEILFHIASFLGPGDLLSVSEVNKKWNAIAEEETFWKRFLEAEFPRFGAAEEQGLDEPIPPFRIHKYLYFSAFKRQQRRPKVLMPYSKRSMLTGEIFSAYATPKHFMSFALGLFGPVIASNIFSFPVFGLRPRHTLRIVYAVSTVSSYLVFRNWGAYYDNKGDRPLETRYRYLGCLGPLIIGQWAAGMHRLARLNSDLYRKRLFAAFDIFLSREVDYLRIIRKYLKTSIWQLSFGFVGYLFWMALFDIL